MIDGPVTRNGAFDTLPKEEPSAIPDNLRDSFEPLSKDGSQSNKRDF
jgi:hypothetical protein